MKLGDLGKDRQCRVVGWSECQVLTVLLSFRARATNSFDICLGGREGGTGVACPAVLVGAGRPIGDWPVKLFALPADTEVEPV